MLFLIYWNNNKSLSSFSSVSCQIYDSPESELKLNDIFEFVGILASDPELEEDNADNDLSNEFCEDPLRHFPPNKVCTVMHI